MDIQPILDRLDGVKRVKPDQWVACCPAHADSSPSLAIRDMGDRALIKCFAGCTFPEITAALGMRQSEFFADSKGSCSVGVPGVTRRDIYRELAFELMTAYVVTRDRAEGKQITPEDAERELLARKRIEKAWRALE